MKFRLLAVLAVMSACAHDLALMKRDETLHAYGAAVRWASFDAATRFQAPQVIRRPLADNLRDVKVSGYRVISQTTDKERMTLIQTVELRYYREGRLVEQTVHDEQMWHYDEDAGKWVIDTPLPRFP